MFRKIVQLLAYLLPYLLVGQHDSISVQTYINGNNIKGLVNANGLLFFDQEKGGQFLTDSLGRSNK